VRGQRPPGLCDKRFASAYLFAAVRPATGEDFCLVLPRVCTEAMDRFLLDFAATVPANTHALMVLDGAGWHDERSVTIPSNVTLVELPPYSPDPGSSPGQALNPVERIWLYLRERYLSHRSWPTTRPLSTPAAGPGTPSPQNQAASSPSATTPTFKRSLLKRGGIVPACAERDS
jgi:hypothetical protein